VALVTQPALAAFWSAPFHSSPPRRQNKRRAAQQQQRLNTTENKGMRQQEHDMRDGEQGNMGTGEAG
jgi:hypothetical protein